MASEIIQVVTTTADRLDADALAQALLAQRLAACVQINGPVDSSYWWNGRLETAREWTCTIKTTRARYRDVERVLLELHPYDEPEVVVMPAVEVSEGYARWLHDQVSPQTEAVRSAEITIDTPAAHVVDGGIVATPIPMPAVLAESPPRLALQPVVPESVAAAVPNAPEPSSAPAQAELVAPASGSGKKPRAKPAKRAATPKKKSGTPGPSV